MHCLQAFALSILYHLYIELFILLLSLPRKLPGLTKSWLFTSPNAALCGELFSPHRDKDDSICRRDNSILTSVVSLSSSSQSRDKRVCFPVVFLTGRVSSASSLRARECECFSQRAGEQSDHFTKQQRREAGPACFTADNSDPEVNKTL